MRFSGTLCSVDSWFKTFCSSAAAALNVDSAWDEGVEAALVVAGVGLLKVEEVLLLETRDRVSTLFVDNGDGGVSVATNLEDMSTGGLGTDFLLFPVV